LYKKTVYSMLRIFVGSEMFIRDSLQTDNCNTGNRNTGNSNTGNRNTGNRNTGNRNTGNRNTGNRNTGNSNTGDWNTGNRNTGYFCEEDGPVMFFDLPCEMTREQAADAIPWVDLPIGAVWVDRAQMTDEEVAINPNCDRLGGYLKSRAIPIVEAMPMVWANLNIEAKRRFLDLPNFDADKFMRITGVDVRQDADLFPQTDAHADPPKTIVIDGVTYRLVHETK